MRCVATLTVEQLNTVNWKEEHLPKDILKLILSWQRYVLPDNDKVYIISFSSNNEKNQQFKRNHEARLEKVEKKMIGNPRQLLP